MPPAPRVAMDPGIDQLLWIGFEQRVRARRFDALVAQASRALEGRDLATAQQALREARELNPSAPVLAHLAAEIIRRRWRTPTTPVARRMTAAAALLAAGIAGLVGYARVAPRESLRPGTPPASSGVVREEQGPRRLVVDSVAPHSHGPHVAPAVEHRSRLFVSKPLHARPRDGASSRGGSRLRRTSAGRRDRNAIPRMLSPAPKSAPIRSRQPDSAAGIAPTTIAVPQPSAAMVERDGTIPGASVAFLLSDAADRVAASAGPGDAAVSLSQLATVLRAYADAYAALDVTATRRLWPSVQQVVLLDVFERRSARHISVDACDISVQGGSADASCRGNAETMLAGSDTRREARLWRFDLRREGDTWKIANAETTLRP